MSRITAHSQRRVETDCPICWQPFEKNEVVWETPCAHLFHKTCFTQWLEQQHTCPMDRRSIQWVKESHYGKQEGTTHQIPLAPQVTLFTRFIQAAARMAEALNRRVDQEAQWVLRGTSRLGVLRGRFVEQLNLVVQKQMIDRLPPRVRIVGQQTAATIQDGLQTLRMVAVNTGEQVVLLIRTLHNEAQRLAEL